MSETHYTNPYSASGNAGRWNPRGVRMIYAASAPAVALLEYVCIKGSAAGNNPWHMITYEIIDDSLIASLDPSSMPADWAELPHPRSTQHFGRAWLEAQAEPFLKVPSCRVSLSFYPMEFNMLINPDYAGLPDIMKVVDTIPFNYLLNKW